MSNAYTLLLDTTGTSVNSRTSEINYYLEKVHCLKELQACIQMIVHKAHNVSSTNSDFILYSVLKLYHLLLEMTVYLL
jgi:hypothetical protein